MNPRGLSQSNWKSNRLSQVMFFFYFCHRRCSIAFYHLESSLFSFFESPSFFCFVFHRRKPLCEPQVTNLRMFFVAFLSGCFAFFVFFLLIPNSGPQGKSVPLFIDRDQSPRKEVTTDHFPPHSSVAPQGRPDRPPDVHGCGPRRRPAAPRGPRPDRLPHHRCAPSF